MIEHVITTGLLHKAAANGQVSTTNWLLQNGFNAHIRNNLVRGHQYPLRYRGVNSFTLYVGHSPAPAGKGTCDIQ